MPGGEFSGVAMTLDLRSSFKGDNAAGNEALSSFRARSLPGAGCPPPQSWPTGSLASWSNLHIHTCGRENSPFDYGVKRSSQSGRADETLSICPADHFRVTFR